MKRKAHKSYTYQILEGHGSGQLVLVYERGAFFWKRKLKLIYSTFLTRFRISLSLVTALTLGLRNNLLYLKPIELKLSPRVAVSLESSKTPFLRIY